MAPEFVPKMDPELEEELASVVEAEHQKIRREHQDPSAAASHVVLPEKTDIRPGETPEDYHLRKQNENMGI